jgi:hypothetical protein
MKKALLVAGIVVIFTACQQSAKKSSLNDPLVLSGEYDELKIAFNPANNQVTGYFESGTGEDAAGGSPQFSCAFYIEGKLTDKQAKVRSFFPLDNFPADNNDLIAGTLIPTANNKLSLKLDKEHGGCSMVQHFKDEPVIFAISKKQNWIAIKYITAIKAFFYTDAGLETKRKAYLVKGNIIYIDEEKNNWVHCTFTDVNNHSTQGWLRSEDINRLE